jgi:hypothetical protein
MKLSAGALPAPGICFAFSALSRTESRLVPPVMLGQRARLSRCLPAVAQPGGRNAFRTEYCELWRSLTVIGLLRSCGRSSLCLALLASLSVQA